MSSISVNIEIEDDDYFTVRINYKPKFKIGHTLCNLCGQKVIKFTVSFHEYFITI